MKYKIELKKTEKMGHAYGSIYLSWFKNDMSHITMNFDEAKEFSRRDLKNIQKRFGDRVILHKQRKGSLIWKKVE